MCATAERWRVPHETDEKLQLCGRVARFAFLQQGDGHTCGFFACCTMIAIAKLCRSIFEQAAHGHKFGGGKGEDFAS